MATQAVTGTGIPKNLNKIKKKKKKQGKKFLVQKAKDCDPSSLETLYKRKGNLLPKQPELVILETVN